MINMFLIILNLIIPSIFLLLKYKKKLIETLPFVMITFVLILFLGGLVKLMLPAVFLIIIANIVLLIFSIIMFIKTQDKREVIKCFITPAFAIWICAVIGLYIIHNGRLLTLWDEFSHWGDVVKAMYNVNDFSTNSETLSFFQSYLPGMSLFQYFFQVINGSFKEGLVLMANQIFNLTLIIYFIKDLKWKKIGRVGLSALCIIILPTIFFNGFYTSSYIDSFLGTIFAFSIFLVLKYDYSKGSLLGIGLSLAMLTLTKDIGIVLAAITILIFLVNQFCIKCKNNLTKERIISLIKNIAILSASVLIPYLLWKLNIELNNAETIFSAPIDISELINILLGNDLTYKTQVVQNYIAGLTDISIITTNLQLNTIIIISILILSLYAIYQNIEHKENKNVKAGFTIIIIGYFCYLALLMVLYIFKFSEYEALRLASFTRYNSTYLQAILLIVFACIFNFNQKKKMALPIFVVSIIVVTPITVILSTMYNKDETIATRYPIDTAANLIQETLGEEKESIYYIVQNETGYSYWALRFATKENLVYINQDGWSIGEEYYEGDIWTKEFAPTEWMDELIENYTYVYLYQVDDYFIERYSILFDNPEDIKNNSFFEINKEKETLILVNTIEEKRD